VARICYINASCGGNDRRYAMTVLYLALDQGTSSSRAMLFDARGQVVATEQAALASSYPGPGWVEQDPEHIWRTSLGVCQAVLAQAPSGADVRAMGITNQRETVVLWDRATGEALAPAIVWQDRRTADDCAALRADGVEPMLQARTGLLADPYFSATKIRWLLDHVPGARRRAEAGELAIGTVESFLMARLTGGRRHVTDATNASRTLLFDIHRGAWDDDLLRLFAVPAALLPEVVDNAGDLGVADSRWFGRHLPITGLAGDQQSALIGQACLQAGMAKSTYGTGCFMLINTGTTAPRSTHRLLGTVAYRIGGTMTYGLEGSIFAAGVAVQWLRDKLGILPSAAASEAIVRRRGGDARGVVLVPAFVGLGAPHWNADARGIVSGLTLDSDADDLIVATLQSVAFQTGDLLRAAAGDGAAPDVLRVDGGMVANGWLCQFLADVLERPVERPAVTETTALGAAMLAALGVGDVSGLEELGGWWSPEQRFEPAMEPARRATLLAGWDRAVARALVPG
jgi:glycerol kinase